MNPERLLSIPADLIRTVAIVGVILLHAANDLTIQQMNTLEIFRWTTVDIYQSLGRLGVPLFVMLTGALLLQPSKQNESLRVFFNKRWARIGLPFAFWVTIYFAWDFTVEHQAFTANAVINGLLKGPYYQFWYLYMLVGLYLLTPILRILVTQGSTAIMRYLVILWVVGASIIPFVSFITKYTLEGDVFVLTGFIGYFILGTYLLNVRIRRRTLGLFMAAGVALTAFGTYMMAWNIGGGETFYFQQYLSPTLIFSAVMLFLILSTYHQPEGTSKENANSKKASPSKGSKLLHLISINTLPIFLLHPIIIYALQRGLLGFTLNGETINSIPGIPLTTAVTLFVCLAMIVPLKKVPILDRFIG